MKKEEFYFDSADLETRIRAVRYIPEGQPKAILQIAHGMVEFIDRYDNFAKYLCDLGFLVAGNDHLGHGKSVRNKNDWGFFAKDDGYNKVLEDIHNLTYITKKSYPEQPYFLLGHSMGSFFARYYLTKYAYELSGSIIMGTGQQNTITLKAGKILCRIISLLKGWRFRSDTINNMALGSYNKKWEPSITHSEWLTKDNDVIETYINDPRCQFVFTINGYYNLFSVMDEIIKKDNLKLIPNELPVLLISGENDPVGDFGVAPNIVYDEYKNIGMKDVTLKLYPNDRHEILNELDKLDVYKYISNWLESKIK